MPVGTTLDAARDILHRHKVEKLLVVDDRYRLKGLITVKDIQKAIEYPNACKDGLGPPAGGRARSGVAKDTLDARRGARRCERRRPRRRYRARPLQGVLDMVYRLRQHFPEVDLIVGNVATGEATRALSSAESMP